MRTKFLLVICLVLISLAGGWAESAQARLAVGGGLIWNTAEPTYSTLIPFGRLSVGLLFLGLDVDIVLLSPDRQLLIPTLVLQIPLLQPTPYVGLAPARWLITEKTLELLPQFMPKVGLRFAPIPFVQVFVEAFAIVEWGLPVTISTPGLIAGFSIGF